VEVATGVAGAALLICARIILQPLMGDRAPYTFVTLGMTIACVLAGWRSGLVALILGQILTWLLVLKFGMSWPEADLQRANAFAAATVGQLFILLVVALYQREVDKSSALREQRLGLLDEALREIDHRTRNNYQNVLGLIRLQAKSCDTGEARAALEQVADRIDAIAKASQRLAVDSDSLAAVRLDDHLCGLVAHIERGLSRDGIELECDVEEVTASSDKAASISIIVNELVTNAIKHAFNGARPGNVWVRGRSGSSFELIIGDNGDGMGAKPKSNGGGLGSRLVESFARQLGAKHEVRSSAEGTTHRLLIPDLH
jgi:two-component sensor histidine kinase